MSILQPLGDIPYPCNAMQWTFERMFKRYKKIEQQLSPLSYTLLYNDNIIIRYTLLGSFLYTTIGRHNLRYITKSNQ